MYRLTALAHLTGKLLTRGSHLTNCWASESNGRDNLINRYPAVSFARHGNSNRVIVMLLTEAPRVALEGPQLLLSIFV